jgi:hypothetical protein
MEVRSTESSTGVPASFDLGSSISDSQLKSIASPDLIYIMTTIKQIQRRMKDPDVVNLEYIRVYDQLGREFDHFFNRYTGIFIRVIKGEDLSILAAVLYYKDQVRQGKISEADLADKLAKKYMPAHLKEDSDRKLTEMRMNNEL